MSGRPFRNDANRTFASEPPGGDSRSPSSKTWRKRLPDTALTTIGALLLAWQIADAAEPVIGGPCDGCENVFIGMPDKLEAEARIAPVGEAGELMILEGEVRTAAGQLASGIVVYAHHTDANGIYPRDTTRHGRLRAWVVTDAQGRYRFITIRPGAYPDARIPQHVHLQVIEPGLGTYYIDELEFDDDPLLTTQLRQSRPGRGGAGVNHPERKPNGAWRVRRDVTLGQNIPGYERARRNAPRPDA